jgi:UDP-N-acetyl-D-mannosaminuronic acid dehydrogenase
MNSSRQSKIRPGEICIVGGAGHVGLPLALSFADKGYSVSVFDINEEALSSIGAGVLPFTEYGAQPLLDKALAENSLNLTSDPAAITEANTVVITIGTPIDEFLNPVHQAVKNCIDGLLSYFRDGQLIVLRSTVFPGTTDWLNEYLGQANESLLLAFCPERVVQGYAIQEISQFPQIVSGTTPEAENAAADLFARIASNIVRLEPIEAEFAKLFSNAYRYIEFAVTNQLYMIANSAGVNYHRVIDGMKKDYPRAKGIPTPGFAAGPCLFKDTMQLAAFASNEFSLGHAAMNVNEGLVLYVIDGIRKKHDLPNLTVGLLGMAFKADVDDTRSSLSYKMKKMLQFHAKEVLVTDPHVHTDPSLLPLEEVIERSDLLILCVPHAAYKDLNTPGTPVVDVWGFIGDGSV